MIQSYQELNEMAEEQSMIEETKSHLSGTQPSVTDHKSSLIIHEKILSHFTVIIPKIDIAFVSKK
jgi:hypothetical protein